MVSPLTSARFVGDLALRYRKYVGAHSQLSVPRECEVRDLRRLAKQDREDVYASRRDYQTISEETSLRLQGTNGRIQVIELTKNLQSNRSGIGGVGGYVRTNVSTEISVSAAIEGITLLSESFTLSKVWSRIGFAFPLEADAKLRLALRPTRAVEYIDFWGLDAGALAPPELKQSTALRVADINFSHLLPETLYLANAKQMSLEIDDETSSEFVSKHGATIHLKKCSYCGRLLPLDPKRSGSLAFHKHNAKLSGHQNECRACKKWRINDSFNPLRTVDQLNESSLITRERRLLLREPEILQRIKEREGRGLKSIVWEKFGKKCFQCGQFLKLKEVELNHTRPLAYLWPIDEHATCLCAEHNNFKKDKFPVDFYSPSQLVQLAMITGLSLEELSVRSVCRPELERILMDIVGFAVSWDARVFNAIARKIRELHPDIDLFERVATADLRVYKQLVKELANRPAPVIGTVSHEEDLLAELEE